MTYTPHIVSQESLFHYQCGHCQQWWTIGDAFYVDAVHCPRCGHIAHVQWAGKEET
jgi:DNA-directed RNA polymerase subunit RPC12/RpoP